MRRFITIFFLFTSFLLLDASAGYYRKIVVGSYFSQADADKALILLNEHMQSQNRIMQLQNEWGFEFIARPSGKYYIMSAEPFLDRGVLQEVLDEIRVLHKDAFVNRISPPKDLPIREGAQKPQTAPDTDQITDAQSSLASDTLKISDIIKKPPFEASKSSVSATQEIIEEKSSVSRAVSSASTQETAEKKSSAQSSSLNAFQSDTSSSSRAKPVVGYLLLGSLLFLIIAMILLWRYRNENKKLHNELNRMDQELLNVKDTMMQKEVFLAKISHELRTPMNAIIGLSHIVLQNKLSRIQEENVTKIKHSGELLLEIINDILDLSKMEAGELKIEHVEFNINDVLDHVSNMVAIKAKNKGLELIFAVEKGVPSHLVGDPLRIGQVLINILGNAVKFTKEGEIDLHISPLYKEDQKLMLEFKITDTGIGMTSDQLSKLFRSFKQADDSTSRIYGGTGLGLSISKQLVELMGGGIRVESQYGKGSVFAFSVEFSLNDAENKRHYRLPSKALMGKRALIIDTNTKSISALSKMLEYFHYEVQTMPILEEAEQLINEEPFDILFVDEQKLSKFAREKIKEIKRNKVIKIVLIESLYNQHKNSANRLNEIDRYLLKPFNQQSIFNIILELYGERRGATSSKRSLNKDDIKVLSGKRILLAEDNEINQRVFAGLLDGSGIAIDMVENGREVLEKLHHNPNYDLIFMDISMPVMDGYEATKLLREYREYDTIPVVALTANSMQDEIEHAISCGMQGYIGKPLNVDDFYGKLLELLGSRRNTGTFVAHEGTKQESARKSQKEELVTAQDDIHMDDGIDRCGGDEVLYNALLRDFLEMYKDAVSVLEDICNEKRYLDGKKFAHDIKGVSANIGAYRLSESALALEEAFLRENQSNYSLLIKNFQENLKRVIKVIEQLVEA
jgi:two-component system sensor histidine kinase/response regulator